MENSSNCVLVRNLRRPFTVNQLKAKLEEYGTVQYFWVDKIKTHCYVQYQEQSQAASAYESLNNATWPEEIGQSLSLSFVSHSECHKNDALSQPSYELNFIKTRAQPQIYYRANNSIPKRPYQDED